MEGVSQSTQGWVNPVGALDGHGQSQQTSKSLTQRVRENNMEEVVKMSDEGQRPHLCFRSEELDSPNLYLKNIPTDFKLLILALQGPYFG